MTQAMRQAYALYRDPEARRIPKVYLGAPELRQLIDAEMLYNISIENSEQHQLAWCLGRVTACRPGSLGASREYPSGLTWRNVTLMATTNPGEFESIVNLTNLKDNQLDPETGEPRDRALACYLTCPSASGLIFSVQHRLLVIALRRNLLVGIETLQELLDSTQRYIKVGWVYLNYVVTDSHTSRSSPITSTIPSSMAQNLEASSSRISP